MTDDNEREDGADATEDDAPEDDTRDVPWREAGDLLFDYAHGHDGECDMLRFEVAVNVRDTLGEIADALTSGFDALVKALSQRV